MGMGAAATVAPPDLDWRCVCHRCGSYSKLIERRGKVRWAAPRLSAVCSRWAKCDPQAQDGDFIVVGAPDMMDTPFKAPSL